MIVITPMMSKDEPEVRDLFAACHPTWDEPSYYWFYAYPTLVALDDDAVVAYSSYAMNTDDRGMLTIMLQDTGVAPHMRGRGLARRLMDTRLDIGRSMGAKQAAGMTQPDNVPMLTMLQSMGFKEVTRIPNIYTNVHPPQDGLVFVLEL